MADKQRFQLPLHFSLLSAQTGPRHDETRHLNLAQDLETHGFLPVHTHGHWYDDKGQHFNEKSFMVAHDGTDKSMRKVEELAFKKYGQEAIIHSTKRDNYEMYADGRKRSGRGIAIGKNLPKPHTEIKDAYKFHLVFHNALKKSVERLSKADLSMAPRADYEKAVRQKTDKILEATKPHYYGRHEGVHVFHAEHSAHKHLIGRHVDSPHDKDMAGHFEDATSSGLFNLIIHGTPPASLRHKAPAASHPHNYDWHDGHSEHELKKGDPLEHHKGNAQAAGAGAKTYAPIARNFGSITPGSKTNLHFYPQMDRHEDAVDGLVKQHGFQTYMAGGRHGKPDLANKNYNTKHLMVYDPSRGSGGDFGNEKDTRSWRKLHELSHALTHPEVNTMYGEGRRMGKLGPRSHKEAARAVHWEWLAAHKQRDLGEQIGIKIPDADFHRELNTVMHDAVHRAIHGQFTEPSDEGFYPTDAKIPLEFSMKKISDAAKEKGIHDPTVEPPELTAGKHGDLTKAFTHGDGETQTNMQTYASAAGGVPSDLMAWGAAEFSPMKRDELKHVAIKGATIKVRKVLADIYTGWIEKDGNILHVFERITLPEMLQQIRSKLEIYEEPPAPIAPAVEPVVTKEYPSMDPKKIVDKIMELQSRFGDDDSQNIKEMLQDIQDKFTKLAAEETAEKDQFNAIRAALKQIRGEIKGLKNTKIEDAPAPSEIQVPAKEMVEGIENPERQCPACERASDQCICYLNLPKPRVEFDGKKFTFFFKSEWNEEDQLNFVGDMKKRVGLLLENSRLKKAEGAALSIRKKLNGKT